MPELPEVEIMARNLHRWMAGRRVLRFEVLDSKFDAQSLRRIEGAEVRRVYRRAKYAVIEFADQQVLILHYRMTGKTVQDPNMQRRARLRWGLNDGNTVVFEDPRRFGTCERILNDELLSYFARKRVGPEPWPDRRDGHWWAERLMGLRGPIKPALMRQDRVAGLGNIAASEILFRAQIHPARSVPSLDTAAWNRIAEVVPQFIAHTLREEGGDEIQYVNSGGEGSFAVYGREGERCPRCPQSFKRMVQSSRSTYFCPGCQSV